MAATRFVMVAILVVMLALTMITTSSEAFRFSLVPGRAKCFTNSIQEEGRYELRYRMARSLTPFVSVSVTAPGGRIMMEHEIAMPDSKEIITLKNPGVIAICFNTAAKASLAATSLNVTLDIIDAEDAELTRMKKQSYSTSSPIALGAGKGSGSMQQMNYIVSTIRKIRGSVSVMTRADEDIRISMEEAQSLSWVFIAVLAVFSAVVALVTYLRIRHFINKYKIQ